MNSTAVLPGCRLRCRSAVLGAKYAAMDVVGGSGGGGWRRAAAGGGGGKAEVVTVAAWLTLQHDGRRGRGYKHVADAEPVEKEEKLLSAPLIDTQFSNVTN